VDGGARGFADCLQAEQRRSDVLGGDGRVVSLALDDIETVRAMENGSRGDRLVCATADTLRDMMRDGDLVARTGEDEFAVLLEGCSSATVDATVARMHAQLARAGLRAGLAGCGFRQAGSFTHAWRIAARLMNDERQQRRIAWNRPAPTR
jgi:GGDEF domain-containing protein